METNKSLSYIIHILLNTI